MPARASPERAGKVSSGGGKKRDSTGSSGLLSSGNIAGAVVSLLAAAYVVYKKKDVIFRPADLTPLRAPKMVDNPEFSGQYANDMLWGSYRSGLYFGMRTRAPKSLLNGLMWFDPDSPEAFMQQKVRHAANQDDRLAQYGWQRHDGRSYGRQTIIDDNIVLTLNMVKVQSEGSGPGGDWAVRLSTARRKGGSGGRQKRVSLVMYLADEDVPKAPWSVLPDGEPHDLREGSLLVTGANKVVGDWSFYVQEANTTTTTSSKGSSEAKPRKSGARLDFLALPSIEGEHDLRLQVRELLMSILYEQLERNPSADRFQLYLPNGATTGSDLAIFQITVPVGATVDWVFLSHNGGPSPSLEDERVKALTGPALTQLIQEREAEFDRQFEKAFPRASFLGSQGSQAGPGSTGGDESGAGSEGSSGSGGGSESESAQQQQVVVDQVVEASKAALSNLLGSMGYFYGQSKVRIGSGESSRVELYWPAALYTAVPSRSFFPRGFLWDEGFHQLIIHRWDPRMSRDVISHWLDLMNSRGWIPREQILGKEAEMRVPPEFVVQDPAHANPPSLLLVLAKMARHATAVLGADATEGQEPSQEDVEEAQASVAFLERAWPRLEVWFRWYNTTQAGQVEHTYRWHGRNATTSLELNPKTLTSGLDDYPRASHPTDDERHLDLRCWMALASHTMALVARLKGMGEGPAEPYLATHAALTDMSLLDSLHWDEASSMYLDWGLHTEGVDLRKSTQVLDGRPQEVAVRVLTGRPPALQFVPHFGYVSLFPLMMEVVPPESPRLGDLLAHLNDSRLLWTHFGLRSLATTSSIYKKYNTLHDPPYWRGQVWINMNFMVLRALKSYAQRPGPYQKEAHATHDRLRSNLVKNLVSEYNARGYLYEQYDDASGRGLSSHPFTGWTALLVLIAANAY